MDIYKKLIIKNIFGHGKLSHKSKNEHGTMDVKINQLGKENC
jgi:hypothetical protein